ncbi:NAD(P)/FAD-dependent oxidoreductase [Aminobacter aminovorans]|jgi:glycine/D-amino acid oxidase-like deaminating enzyme|uniref:FAD dependent oxidoreductase family protein n=1 Tax=Aminobacter aminovorans TaxID=83263 RepID=A0AAC8YUV5_AMIAI|nr:FAD-binding oxidoreductase [Aminobacter aminovorans]AMS44915.1 FAD dependent oxidoreductase family protein [Aminobacter aminovorans]MBB3704896.1 glycine/D-amino acid oxidase-like deaminating enzyme [Aminobacter aminovorans]
MAPVIHPVRTTDDMSAATTVVVIGGGIVGLSAALVLVERGIPVVVLEKGRIAAEQSSRNLGWVRKTLRGIADAPLAIEAERLWQGMAERTGIDPGFRQSGIMYLARTEAEAAKHQAWLTSVAALGLDSRLVTGAEIDALVPGGKTKWHAGLYTASDARAEPTLANTAIATAAIAKGAVVVENCAVRALSMAGGRVAGVVTERGEIACDQVLLAGGIWSRRFLGNMGIGLPTLPLAASVLRTTPMEGPSQIAVGASDFSFRKRLDGGYTITQRGALFAPLTPDHLRIGLRYLPMLRAEWANVRIGLGRPFLADVALARRWRSTAVSPFERVRTFDPEVNSGLIDEAMCNLSAAWPVFNKARIAQCWAGMIDVTPDSLPVIGAVDKVPGLTLATGFSGHGFGTGPAAAQLAVDLMTGEPPLVSPAPYRPERLLH